MNAPKLLMLIALLNVDASSAADGSFLLTPTRTQTGQTVVTGLPSIDIAQSHSGFARKDAIELVGQYLGPAFNQTVVRKQLQERFNAALKMGYNEAERLGQRGFVIRMRLRERQADAGLYYTLKDDGVAVVGAGPSLDAICLAERCGTELKSETVAGESLTANSGYVWVEPIPGGKANFKFYKLEKVEQNVQFATLNSELLRESAASAKIIALDGYVKRLGEMASKAQDAERVQKLLKQREDSRTQLAKIEGDLAAELKRQKKASDAASTLGALSTVFSLASSIAAMNAMTGESVEQLSGGPITSKEGLLKFAKELSTSSGKKVQALQLEQRTFTDSISGTETQLFGIGVQYKMDPNSSKILNPRLN